MRMRTEAWESRAFSLRYADAWKGIDREATLTEIASRALAEIGTPTPDRLREAGGWTKVIEEVLGAGPDPIPNELGMPTALEWYRWRSLKNSIPDIRNIAVSLLQNPLTEKRTMSIHASDAALFRAASYGVRMTGPQHDYSTPEGEAYLDAVHEGPCLEWTDRRLKRITILRLLSDPGYPFWDVSYIHGETVDGKPCRVTDPFGPGELRKRSLRSDIIAAAKRDGVYAKGLGIFDAISTLQ